MCSGASYISPSMNLRSTGSKKAYFIAKLIQTIAVGLASPAWLKPGQRGAPRAAGGTRC